MATLVPVNYWSETKGKVSEAEERTEKKITMEVDTFIV